MKRLPIGISNYEKLIEDGYIYVDKTMYIEKLENFPNPTVMFLRPRKFGKTLFTSTLESYYDILKKDKFETLFRENYIGKNPTPNKNKYYVLKFNFSGVDTNTEESTINGFKNEVVSSVNLFAQRYGLDFYINNNDAAEVILNNLFNAFYFQKPNEKIFVIIDEYDHFANELLGFQKDRFKELVSRNGKVRKWYEILKKGTETIVERIFITGVAPITLDSLTSGFNIATDISRDVEFNDMMGFTHNELVDLMNSQEISEETKNNILPIMKQNYDGYKFNKNAEDHIYNSNMCLYFLSNYVRLGRMPDSLIDVNIASDYAKLSGMLKICETEGKVRIIEDTISGKGIISEITDKFNPEVGFGDTELISMLFYMGYLTIKGDMLGLNELQIPNMVMKELYAEYFLNEVKKETNLGINVTENAEIIKGLAYEGKIEKMIDKLHQYLNNLSNRDFKKFDEKYVKILFYSIAMNFKATYSVKSEFEVNREFPDLLLIPRDRTKGYYSIMIEFKYIKKENYTENYFKEKQEEAIEQIESYGELDDIKDLENLRKYAVVAVVDEIYVEEIKT